jgi:hypothetical protein
LREQLVDRQRCLRCRQAGRRSRHVPNENKTQTLEDSPREGLPPEHRNVSLSALFSRS